MGSDETDPIRSVLTHGFGYKVLYNPKWGSKVVGIMEKIQ